MLRWINLSCLSLSLSLPCRLATSPQDCSVLSWNYSTSRVWNYMFTWTIGQSEPDLPHRSNSMPRLSCSSASHLDDQLQEARVEFRAIIHLHKHAVRHSHFHRSTTTKYVTQDSVNLWMLEKQCNVSTSNLNQLLRFWHTWWRCPQRQSVPQPPSIVGVRGLVPEDECSDHVIIAPSIVHQVAWCAGSVDKNSIRTAEVTLYTDVSSC